MIIVVYLCICILSCVMGVVSLDISKYVHSIDDNGGCEKCGRVNECPSQKKIFNDSTLLDEFILISYVCTKRNNVCPYINNLSRLTFLYYFIINAMLVGVLFWSGDDSLTCIVFGVSAAMLLALSIVDWNTQYIPVEYTGVIFLCGLIRLFADVSNWWEYVIGLIAVSGFLYVVDKIGTFIIRRRDPELEVDGVIGDGDIKLMAATGLLLGWKLNFLALGIGCIAGSVIHVILMKIKGSERRLALGPYLSLGVYITMICGEQLVSWYLNMMRV